MFMSARVKEKPEHNIPPRYVWVGFLQLLPPLIAVARAFRQTAKVMVKA